MQSKLVSLLESFINIFIGYTVAVISQMAIFPMFGIQIELKDNLLIGFYFTLISIIRSYTVRRFFNAILIGTYNKHEINEEEIERINNELIRRNPNDNS